MARVAFLGLGQMGQAISKNLIAKGRLDGPLMIWNRTRLVAEEVEKELGNVRVAESIGDILASADIIWSCLANEGAVEDVYEQLLQGDVDGKLFVECSSIPSTTTNALNTRVREAGAEFLSMPVFGDPGLAQKGMLICIPSGSAGAIERVKPYLVGVIAKASIELVDEQPGNASRLKLIGNTLILSSMEAVAEALVFADKAGVGSQNMAQVISALFPLPPHALYLQRMMSGEYHEGKPMATLEMAEKLAGHVLAMANDSAASVPAYEVAVRHLTEAREAHHAQGDITSIYGAIRVASGLPFKNETTSQVAPEHESRGEQNGPRL